MPVIPNFVVTHQWLRELRRGFQGGRVTFVGVYFRVPDQEIVSVGHYGQAHQDMTAAAATDYIASLDDALGFEVLFAHTIRPAAIYAIRPLPQGLGWRYMPGAHGRRPRTCRCCLGGFKARRIHAKYANQ